MAESIEDLLARARYASPNDRIDMRDEIAAHGVDAVEAMGEWLADPELCRFAVRVIGKVADLGVRESAVAVLQAAREQTTRMQRADIDSELRRGARQATPQKSRLWAPHPTGSASQGNTLSAGPQRRS